MKTTKTFDCVEMKRKGSLRIHEANNHAMLRNWSRRPARNQGETNVLDYLLKDIGWPGLLILYPFVFLIVWKLAKMLQVVWGDPAEGVGFASMPKGVVGKPNKCHRYFAVILIGIGCLIWVALATPIWVVAHNESVPSIVDEKTSNPILVAVALPLGASVLIAVYVGFPALLYGYGVAWYVAMKEGREKPSETNA